MRVCLQLVEGEPVRSEPQHQVEPPLGSGVPGEPGRELLGVGPVRRRVLLRHGLGEGGADGEVVHGRGRRAVEARDGEDQPGVDLALVHPVRFEGDGRRGVADLVADGEPVEGEVEVGAPGGRGRGQQDVGVAGGLVEVRVDGDHEVEGAEGRVEAVSVGGGQDGVGGEGEEGPDAPLPRGLDLLGERDQRQLPLDLGVVRDPAVPAAEGEPPAGSRGARGGRGGGEREERAAGPVEVAGEDVEDVDQPVGEGAVLHGGAAHPPVDGGGGRGGELPGEGADGGGVHVAGGGDRLGGELPYRGPYLLDALDVGGERSEVGEVLREKGVDEGGEEQRVGAGADRDVPVGEARGAGAPGVDDGEGAAASSEGLEPAGEVGGGAQAAVGGQRVGAEDQQVVGAVQVRHGDGEGVTEEQAAGDVLGHLVERGRREEVPGAQRADEQGRVEGSGDRVHIGVAQDDTHRVRPVLLDDRTDSGGDRVERLVPVDLPELAALPYQGAAEPVRVGVDLGERGAFRADEPLAEDVVAVAARPGDPAPFERQGQSAGRFAEGADTQGRGHGVSLGRRVAPSIPTGREGGEGCARSRRAPALLPPLVRSPPSRGGRRSSWCGKPSSRPRPRPR